MIGEYLISARRLSIQWILMGCLPCDGTETTEPRRAEYWPAMNVSHKSPSALLRRTVRHNEERIGSLAYAKKTRTYPSFTTDLTSLLFHLCNNG